jgi:hypothetical protein
MKAGSLAHGLSQVGGVLQILDLLSQGDLKDEILPQAQLSANSVELGGKIRRELGGKWRCLHSGPFHDKS